MFKTNPFQARAEAGTDIFLQINSNMIVFSGAGWRNFWHGRVFLWSEVILPVRFKPVNSPLDRSVSKGKIAKIL